MGPTPRYDSGDGGDAWDWTSPRSRRSWLQRAVLATGVVASVACLSASGFVSYQNVQISNFERFEDVRTVEVAADQPQNWLVVGSDTRDVIKDGDANAGGFTAGGRGNSSGKRSDTIMIVRVDAEAERLDILSLQRDLYVKIAGTNRADRINSAYAMENGQQRLIDTIKQNFNVDIHHYVEINFASFQGIVDAVGGLPMYFDKAMRDGHSGLDVSGPACTVLNGDQALAFARSRYLEYRAPSGKWVSDPTSDLGRISRQQYFMRKMFDRAGRAASNPLTMSKLIGVANQFVGLDAKIDVGQAAELAKKFGKFQGDSIQSWTLPTKPENKGGADVLTLELAGTVAILNRFRGLDEKDADPRSLTFPVENASGTAGRSEQVRSAYWSIGYQATLGPDRPVQERTQLRHGFMGQDAAAQIERHLTAGADIVADPDLAPGVVVLVVGMDLTTVMQRPRPFTPLLPVPGSEVPGTDAPGTTTTTTTTTTRGGTRARATTNSKASTTSTTVSGLPPTNNTGDTYVGIVPGQPPDGVTCE